MALPPCDIRGERLRLTWIHIARHLFACEYTKRVYTGTEMLKMTSNDILHGSLLA